MNAHPAPSERCLQDMPDPAWCAHCICGARAKLPDVEPLDEPYPAARGTATVANYPSRCHHRPGCLAGIDPGDEIVRVDNGWALLEHVGVRA